MASDGKWSVFLAREPSILAAPGVVRPESESCRPPRQPPCARVPRSFPVAAQAEPRAWSFRLRDAVSSWEFGNQFTDVPQLHQVCQTQARMARSPNDTFPLMRAARLLLHSRGGKLLWFG